MRWKWRSPVPLRARPAGGQPEPPQRTTNERERRKLRVPARRDSPQANQGLPRLVHDRIVGALVPVEIVDGSSQEVRTPLATDPPGVFQNRGQELVFVAVIARLAAQPAMGGLYELGNDFGPIA